MGKHGNILRLAILMLAVSLATAAAPDSVADQVLFTQEFSPFPRGATSESVRVFNGDGTFQVRWARGGNGLYQGYEVPGNYQGVSSGTYTYATTGDATATLTLTATGGQPIALQLDFATGSYTALNSYTLNSFRLRPRAGNQNPLVNISTRTNVGGSGCRQLHRHPLAPAEGGGDGREDRFQDVGVVRHA
jgi:hypothetical protein